MHVNVTAWNNALGLLNSLLGGDWCPDVMCMQEHHVTAGKITAAKNQARGIGYGGCLDAATPTDAGGTQSGTAVLARTHLATSLFDFYGTPPMPLGGTGRVTACHVWAGPRNESALVSTYICTREAMSHRNSDMIWEVAEWLVAIGRPFI